MKVLDFLVPSAISIDLKGQTKLEVIQELVELLVQAGKLKDARPIVGTLREREKLGSTGIGQGIAIPHGKSDQVSEIVAAFGVSKRGVEFDSLDGEPVYLVFLLVAPLEAAGIHLKALAKISRLLKDKFFRQAITEAKGVEDVLRIIKEEDAY
ncbi:MAG: PTS sugar transporter subunit IIA [Elusimicrobia bacterium]|nr:PTS sugar transporter subunit IIA [Elusimicrobiota bacterium]